MNGGYIALHRKLFEWEWYSDINVKTVFIHCIMKANFKNRNWQGVEIKRGAFVTGINTLSVELNMSIQKIRTALKKLQKTNEISIKTTNKNSIITVCNYDSYQHQGDGIQQANNKQITNGQQAKDKQTTTTNNANNKKKGNKDNKRKGEKSNFDFSVFSQKLLSFFKKIAAMFPNSIIDNLSEHEKLNWLNDLVKLNTQDGLSLQEIKQIVEYGRNNQFWKQHFLTILKLRKKNKDGVKFWLIFQEQMKNNKQSQNKKVIHDSDY